MAFLIPRTLRFGAVLLLLTLVGAMVVHAARGEWRPDLLVYAAGVVLVAVHGSAYRNPPRGVSSRSAPPPSCTRLSSTSPSVRASSSPAGENFWPTPRERCAGSCSTMRCNRRTKKRGGEFQLTAVDGDAVPAGTPDSVESMEQLTAALDQLAKADLDLAQLVDLHFFCGFSFGEVAELRGVSVRTVQRD